MRPGFASDAGLFARPPVASSGGSASRYGQKPIHLPNFMQLACCFCRSYLVVRESARCFPQREDASPKPEIRPARGRKENQIGNPKFEMIVNCTSDPDVALRKSIASQKNRNGGQTLTANGQAQPQKWTIKANLGIDGESYNTLHHLMLIQKTWCHGDLTRWLRGMQLSFFRGRPRFSG
jgi:hypothetical protein